MRFIEKTLEDIIFETPNENLNDRGLCIYGKKLRQVRIGNYGICDLITIDKEPDETPTNWTITVYELKKDFIDFNTLCQALRYARGVTSYINKRFKGYRFKVNICLIGSSIQQTNGFCYLNQFMDSLSIYTYDYKFDGIEFDEHGTFTLKNEGF